MERAGSVPIFLTTLKSTVPFYARAGFQEIPLSKAPRWLLCKPVSFLTRLSCHDLLCLPDGNVSFQAQVPGPGSGVMRVKTCLCYASPVSVVCATI